MMIQAKIACYIVGMLSAICLLTWIGIQVVGGIDFASEVRVVDARSSLPDTVRIYRMPDPIPFHLISPMAQKLGSNHSGAQDDLVALHEIIVFYAMEIEEPVLLGSNQEITRGLLRKDGLGRAMISSDHPSINSVGQLVDRWRTPFFFQTKSSNGVEVISAGPDRVFYTEDDMIWPEPLKREYAVAAGFSD